MSKRKLTIKSSDWQALIWELRERGMGVRESGAFLLGPKGTSDITTFLCYDSLDPHCYDIGIITFDGDGYIPLWNYCLQYGLQVFADVHTHPGQWTGQSQSDRRHPMIAQPGHLALIVPCFAQNPHQLLKGVGIHEFRGNRTWKTWKINDHRIRII